MRDGKLYKELGYANFEDYCENEVGMKRRNVYNYISIVENVENVQSIAQIGMTKLSLLATISGEQQQELSKKVNLEETTVKQLKAEIDKLKSEKKNYEELIEDINADKHEAEAQAEQAEYNLKDTLKELKEAKGENSRLEKQLSQQQENYSMHTKRRNERISELEKQVKELESRPIDVAVVDNSAEYEEKLKAALEAANQENRQHEAELEAKFRAENESIRKKLEEEKQTAISEVRSDYEKKLSESAKASPVDEDKLKFKVYLTSAYDSLKRLTEFSAQYTEPIYKDKIRQLINNVLAVLEEDKK